ncbi:hypothetical protein [Shewanella sp. HN-41]|uniref:hypothetical protein n=1 Tax=Shewanella sp. HN-41 TaxID=327275 RepID=UPI0002125DC2|nr:hypothetical protein [Shewanella sp. HN-41]EGM70478.1 hypothetical protein SOHN41_01491 [Shewanella sp. HN-41]
MDNIKAKNLMALNLLRLGQLKPFSGKRVFNTVLIAFCLVVGAVSDLSAAEDLLPRIDGLKPVQPNQALLGSWQLVSGQYLDDKAQWVDYQTLNLTAIKVISEGHFSFTTMKVVEGKRQFWAAGAGTYQATATEYRERPELNSFGVSDRAEFVFSYRIEGHQWHTQRFEEGELKETEVWQRLD